MRRLREGEANDPGSALETQAMNGAQGSVIDSCATAASSNSRATSTLAPT